MNKLQEIVIEKRKQVAIDKQLRPAEMLESSRYYNRTCASVKEYITRGDKSGIITEIKKKSPALGAINTGIQVEALAAITPLRVQAPCRYSRIRSFSGVVIPI